MDDLRLLAQRFHCEQTTLTVGQIYDALIGIIKSGDLIKYLTPAEIIKDGDNVTITQKQGMSYLPFREGHSLRWEVKKLKEALEFYADNDTNVYKASEVSRETIILDQGQVAREALGWDKENEQFK